MSLSKFYIHNEKSSFYSNKALDWLIRSWDLEPNTPEWKICMLKKEIYEAHARTHLLKAHKYLKEGVNA